MTFVISTMRSPAMLPVAPNHLRIGRTTVSSVKSRWALHRAQVLRNGEAERDQNENDLEQTHDHSRAQ